MIGLLRLFGVNLIVALQQLWANKMRSLLTTIGIVIGIAAVTAVVGTMSGMKSYVLDQYSAWGVNKIYISPSWPDDMVGPFDWDKIAFKPEHTLGWAQHCPSVAFLTRTVGLDLPVAWREETAQSVRIQGVDPDWFHIEDRSVQHGRVFSLIDVSTRQPVCLINEALRLDLRLPVDCIGKVIRLGSHRLHIVGVLEDKEDSQMFGFGGSDSEVILPFGTAWDFGARDQWIVAASRSPDVAEHARAELRFFLRQSRHIKPTDPDNFRIEVIDRFIRDFEETANKMTMFAVGIMGISLLVGGVGIMNIMLVSVSERTREIGLRKAIGATPAVIMMQFLIEAVVLCLVGGVMGIAVGQGITTAVTMIPGLDLPNVVIPGWAMAMSVGFAGSVGIIFGMFPAIKAAALDPIEALRHE